VTTGRSGDLLQDDVAALGPERGLHGLGELVDACQQQGAGFLAETQFLGHWSSCDVGEYEVLGEIKDFG
jgi:hypothetical protein